MHNPPLSSAGPACWWSELRVGPGSPPYIADHGFQDMVVLPGSYFVALVCRMHQELFQKRAVSLRHIEFEKPVILAEDEIVITIRAEQRADGAVAYELFEALRSEVESASVPPPCARLLVEDGVLADSPAAPFQADAVLADAVPLGTAEDFYARLRRNGNQYGPQFQTLAATCQSGDEIVGQLADASREDGQPAPTLLDAGVQLLGALAIGRNRTFLLQAIEQLVIVRESDSAPRWLRARRTSPEGNGGTALVGDVDFFDAAGALLWKLRGVSLAFLEPASTGEPAAPPETPLCLTATFTAEPLEESLRFWGGYFGRNLRVEFAPYNQVFQQLLDPASALRRNRDGLNSVVLDLKDWLPEKPHALAPLTAERAADVFENKARCILPHGLEIAHLNQYETDYVYDEIFKDECYLRHDIQIRDGDTVVDIGANIGLFTLFVLDRCRNPRIYSYEPSPQVFDLLRANCAAYGEPAHVHPFNYGVADKAGREHFTFYEHSSVFSSFHPDEGEDRAAIQAVVRNVLQNELTGADSVPEEDVEDLTTHRLAAQTIECQITSVSDIIRENGLTRIHLLKVDAEKCEQAILSGIDEEHWPLIDQIVMEVHDRSRASLDAFEEMLRQRGFRCAVVEEKLLTDSGLFNIYATRQAPAPKTFSSADAELSRKTEEFCAALDAFAAASAAPLVLAIAPRAASAGRSQLEAAEERVLAHAARYPQMRCLSSSTILKQYPVRVWHDRHSDQLGHVPFTMEGYAALGTAISRALFQLDAPPVKVIALDCDNTLWKGVCGEDGPQGVDVSAPFRRLQEFMIAQAQAGVLIALCSKNNEAEALAVFDQHPQMLLRREHLAGWRINWEDKPDNLRALATHFNVGLDSFVFLDDNPLECATVRAACPEVTVLQLPAENERLPAFLENLWIFDRSSTTREDRERGAWYRANAGREELRTATPTLQDFLEGLQLRIDVTEVTDGEIERVSQLLARTNQFNFTAIEHSEGELHALLKSGTRCLVTRVNDRFGDYGLVGAILYTAGADHYVVENLLLSCRALGKGVEHRMVAELAARASAEGKASIHFACRKSGRNEPALAFFERLRRLAESSSEFHLAAPVSSLVDLTYTPDEHETGVAPGARPEKRASSRRNWSAALQRLGEELVSVESIVAAMEAARQPAGAVAAEPLATGSTMEQSLAAIWKKGLGRTQLGYDENFFDAGGTSLKAVMVVAMIRKQLKKTVSIVSLFESPTIRLLAARLEDSGEGKSASSTAAELRGSQRRSKLARRGGRSV
ncbi:MAG: FkbM family methyltransferase [Chthoniobacter sp.]|uniref:FkbM family methyltransferase n=1 Tax=Chthoniobacter sp. TaxID=2510640 RepID=UPI0032AC0BA0